MRSANLLRVNQNPLSRAAHGDVKNAASRFRARGHHPATFLQHRYRRKLFA
jgi:hypothetical protein